jgi:hypothetical protein
VHLFHVLGEVFGVVDLFATDVALHGHPPDA